MESFQNLDLFAPLGKALAELDYQTPTPIQAKTIPPAMDGLDILGCAKTGTGKTAAFALPVLDFIGNERPKCSPKFPAALVLAPTRELASQISANFAEYGKHMRFRQATVYGGVGKAKQVSALRAGVDVLIATPGRLLDLMDQGDVKLGKVQMFVLDEADRMLDMGFRPALKRIIAALPEERQSLFFSATLAPGIRKLAAELLFNPVSIDVSPKSTGVAKIDQTIRIVDRSKKFDTICTALRDEKAERVITFTRTKHGANALAKKLDRSGIGAVAIHGNKSQAAREKALHAFRNNKVSVLVATDVAARGIDIDGVTHVINYDMPVDPESYVHRVGRTGRAGASGIAVSYCTLDERDKLLAIEALIGKELAITDPDSIGFSRHSKSNNAGGKSNGPRGKSNGSGSKSRSGGFSNGNKGRGKFKKNKKKRRPEGASMNGRP
ncbi:ATP-dependent RNA helicase RhlE [Stieleria bergensis]|uniref:ATP-dependent RNA helicase RhlE n=1 Tax=Stieleria bergensis TaxID=2528025 RepID=A0A517ST99_9BACT|nr:ATP-dependent RNA helicase RhlE [Planctomycetes bacterium SV_7m_r]